MVLEVESLVGTCVNTLALRMDCGGSPTFRTFLRRVHDGGLEAFANQDVPFERLVEEPGLARAVSRAPIAQVMFIVQNVPLQGATFTDLNLQIELPTRGAAQFELAITLETELTRSLVVEYSTELYDAATIVRFSEQFVCMLEAACDQLEVPIAEVSFLPEDERKQLLTVWNATDSDYPSDTVTSRLIEAQTTRAPESTAIVADDGTWTYAQLEVRANQIAHHASSLGAGHGSVVAICLPRTPNLVAALLAIQKTGAAYLPLDPLFPADRIAYMLEDSGTRLLLTDTATAGVLTVPDGIRVIDVTAEAQAIAAQDSKPLAHTAAPSDPAYIIYTSGSTGKPKGVVVPHGALVNFLCSMRREPGLAAEDVVAAVTTVSFDISALELYGPLLVGARVALVPRDVSTDGARLIQRLADTGATLLQATPATWRLLVEAGWRGQPGFRALTGGEALPAESRRAAPGSGIRSVESIRSNRDDGLVHGGTNTPRRADYHRTSDRQHTNLRARLCRAAGADWHPWRALDRR